MHVCSSSCDEFWARMSARSAATPHEAPTQDVWPCSTDEQHISCVFRFVLKQYRRRRLLPGSDVNVLASTFLGCCISATRPSTRILCLVVSVARLMKANICVFAPVSSAYLNGHDISHSLVEVIEGAARKGNGIKAVIEDVAPEIR